MQQPPNPYPQYPQQQWQQPSQPLPPPQQRQQQPDYTQPKTYNSPQNKPSPPPSTPKTLDGVLWLLIGVAIGLVIGLVLGTSVGKQTTTTTTQDTTQSVSQSTQAATYIAPSGTWATTHTFTGNGNKKTAIFTVPADWKILWSCKGLTDGTNIDGVIYISAYGSDNSPVDANAVSGTCTYGKTTSDSTEEHQSGNVYLEVNTGLPWTIQVQELK